MLQRKLALTSLLAVLAGGALHAASNNLTNYVTGDVLICFQNGGRDLVVDAGPVSTLLAKTANSRTTISAYTTTQINQVGVDGVQWSAFTWLADNTLYMTKARTDLATQTTPWAAANNTSQNNIALRMATIPPGAADNLAYKTQNTATAIIEPNNSSGNPNYVHGVSYHNALSGSYGSDWNGLFPGDPENDVDGSFQENSLIARSDFYQLTPTSGNATGTLVGYFELQTDGTMVYVAYPSATPVITSISHAGNQTTIYYTTGLYGTYTLRSHSNLTDGTAQLSWTSVATLTSGDSATHSITFTDSSSSNFYTITAQ
jgi:hypothetical protein